MASKTNIGIRIYCYILIALFITGSMFRLSGVWTVSWWIITLPIWGGLAIVLLALGFFVLCMLIVASWAEIRRPNRRASKKIIIKHSTLPEPPIRGELKN